MAYHAYWMPWRPLYEGYALLGWLAGAAVNLWLAWFSDLPADLFKYAALACLVLAGWRAIRKVGGSIGLALNLPTKSSNSGRGRPKAKTTTNTGMRLIRAGTCLSYAQHQHRCGLLESTAILNTVP
jgi:hypothetical protein